MLCLDGCEEKLMCGGNGRMGGRRKEVKEVGKGKKKQRLWATGRY